MSENIDRPSGLEHVESTLRALLAQEANRIMPSDRYPDIHRQTAATPRPPARPTWLLAAAAALVVAVLGVGGYLALRPGPSAPLVPGATPVVTAPPSAGATATPTAAVGHPTATTPAGLTKQLPVYYVGAGTTVNPHLLHRDFLNAQPIGDGSTASVVAAAVTISASGRDLTGHSLPAYPGYLAGWDPDTTVTAALPGSGDGTAAPNEIRLVLNKPGRAGLTADEQRIAVQSLVWTATAAAQAALPVRIEVADGGPIFDAVPAGVHQRPADTTAELAPIWVTDPLRASTVPASAPVTVTGEACTFEGSFAWELLRDGAVVTSGHGTASAGCPTRGTFAIPLGVLAPGPYTIRVWEVSMKDGSVFTEERMPFTVG